MQSLSQSDLILTIAFVLVEEQRALTAQEIQSALSVYKVSAEKTMRALRDGPFRRDGERWGLGREPRKK
jgi:hypothetical protein